MPAPVTVRPEIMSAEIVCYNCGASLAALTLPLSRRDMCPSCSVHVHVCRMCVAYDPRVTGQCREEDAEEVRDKERVNFCDWFSPAAGAYDSAGAERQARASADLDALFGDAAGDDEATDDAHAEAENLFK